MSWICMGFIILTVSIPGRPFDAKKAFLLEEMTWMDAEKALKHTDVVVIALGASSKEHGPHLQLNNDFLMAEYLKNRVADELEVAILPTIPYGYYPAFLEYPGSVSLRSETFVDVVIDICTSMHGYGLRKFYVINTGVSTLRPLAEARDKLAVKGIILRYLNILAVDESLPAGLLKQEGGTHADEGETSMMLYIAPETVQMDKAVKDYDPRPGRKGLTRHPQGTGHFSPTGIWGDPTLATREKGKIIVEAAVAAVIHEIRELMSLKLR